MPGGTPLKGLGYFKGRDAPVAMEDHEYPEWLWGLLDEAKKSGAAGAGGSVEGDEYG